MSLIQESQIDTSVYICTFQCMVRQATIMMKFPCSYFVEWTTSGGKSIAITSKYKPDQNHVTFNQTLSLTTQMIFNHVNSEFSKKQTLIELYLVSRSRPDQNKLVGRVNIDLSKIINFDMYARPTQFKLNFCSVQGSLVLQFSVSDQRLTSKKVQDLDRSSFIDYISQLAIKGNRGSTKIRDSLYKGQSSILEGIQENQNTITSMKNFNVVSPTQFKNKYTQFPKKNGIQSDIHTTINRKSVEEDQKVTQKVDHIADIKRNRFTFGQDAIQLQKSQESQAIPKQKPPKKQIEKQQSNPTLVDQIIQNSRQQNVHHEESLNINAAAQTKLKLKTPVHSLQRQESMGDFLKKNLKQKADQDQILAQKDQKIKTLEKELENAYKESQQNIMNKQKQLKIMIENYNKAQTLVKDYDQQMEISRKRNASLSQQINEKQDQINNLSDKLSISNRKYEEIVEVYNQLEIKYNELLSNNNHQDTNAEQPLGNYHEQISELNKQLYEYEHKQSQYQQKFMALQQMVRNLQDVNEKSRNTILQLQTTKEQLQDKIKFVQSANQQLQSEIQLHKSNRTSTIDQTEWINKLNEKNYEIKQLKAQIDMLKVENAELASDKECWEKAYEQQVTIVEELKANNQHFEPLGEQQPKKDKPLTQVIEQLKLKNKQLADQLQIKKQQHTQALESLKSVKQQNKQYEEDLEELKITYQMRCDELDGRDQIEADNIEALKSSYEKALKLVREEKQDPSKNILLSQQKEQIDRLNGQIEFLKESLQLLESTSNEDNQRAKEDQQRLLNKIKQLEQQKNQTSRKSANEERMVERVKTLEESIGFYRAQIDRLIENSNASNEILNQQRTRNRQLLSQNDSLSMQVRILENEKNQGNKNKQIDSWEERRQDYEMRLASLNNNLEEQINQNNELSQTIVKYIEKQAKMKQTLTILEEESKQLFIMFQQKEHNEENYQKMIDDLQKEIDRMRTNFYEIHNDTTSPSKSILSSPKVLRGNSSPQSDQMINNLQTKIEELQKQLHEIRFRYKNASAEYESQVEKLTQQLIAVTNNYNKMSNNSGDKATIDSEVHKKDVEVQIWKARSTQNEEERNKLREEMEQMKIQMELIEEQKFNLESTINEKDIMLLEKQQQIEELVRSLTNQKPITQNRQQTQSNSQLQQIYSSFLNFKNQLTNQTRSGDWEMLTKNILDRSIGGEEQTKILVMEEKSRLLSKELQKLKAQLMKATSRNQQEKLIFMGLIKKCEVIVAELIEVAESLNLNQSSFL